MLLKNAEIFYQGAFKEADLLIADGKIELIGSSLNISCPDNEDLTGYYIIPGLVDIHTHGCLGLDFTDASSREEERMCNYYARHGVTSIIKTIMTAPLKNMFNALSTALPSTGAHIQGVRLEGPFLNPAKRGAHKAELLKAPDPALIQDFLSASENKLRIIDIAPELQGALPLISSFSENVRFSIAHTQCTYSQALEALNAGALSFTHLFNAMEPIKAREPGSIGAFLDSAAYGECIGDLFHVHRANLKMLFKQSAERLCLISDSVAAGLADGSYVLNGRQITVKHGQAYCPDGTIAGSSVNLFQCLKNAVSLGMPLAQAVLSCTLLPAKAAGIESQCGSLLPGRNADMIIMDRKLKIKKILMSGKNIL